MHEIILHGDLKKRYGESFTMDVSTPAEVIRALCSQLKGIEEDIRKGVFRVVRGDIKKGTVLGEEDLLFSLGKEKEFHIVPVPAGAKRSGIGKTILGVALIAVSIIVPPLAPIASQLGFSLVLSGISSLLTPTQKVSDYGQREQPDQRPSFLFNGAVNVAEQGLPIPLVYGQMRTGSVVISAGITTTNVR